MAALNPSLRYLLSIVVLPAAVYIAGCCTLTGQKEGAALSVTLPTVTTRSAAEQALAEALWSYHEAAITTILASIEPGNPMAGGGRDFDEALTFFESTTGILSNTGTRFGRIITPELPGTLDRWRQWHREHRNQLHFDQENCDLGVSPIQNP
jgi:hypothetical protein